MVEVKERSSAAAGLPMRLQGALDHGVLRRIPLTFLPFVNQQLHTWEFLFPSERGAVERLLLFVDAMSEESSRALFHHVIRLEEQMGVSHWQFSTTEQTIQNSSELARSPYFLEWRRAVQDVFDAADRNTATNQPLAKKRRLILIDLPSRLPVRPNRVWNRWEGIGKVVRLSAPPSADSGSILDDLLFGAAEKGGLLAAASTHGKGEQADAWVVDAGRELVEKLVSRDQKGILLSYERLDAYREHFSHEMNTMRKDLADADAVFDRLRHVDVAPWCPPEVGHDPAVREFVRALYLSGNGAVIFGNSFTQWAVSEALRRGRPSFVVARFGVRSRPKPFTGVAVFENPDRVNPLPGAEDLEGSALDAEVLALYIWLAAMRYPEYQGDTVCVCLAESLGEAYAVCPAEFSWGRLGEPVSIERFRSALVEWIG